VPENIRKLQATKLSYREQFPIDLSCNLTAYGSQGQTWKNSKLSVNLGFESPQNKIPPDAASIAYVACTRMTKLKDLFVSPIFLTVWQQMGRSERDNARRKHKETLKTAAQKFASETGMYDECKAEIEHQEDYSTVDEEWQHIVADSGSLHSSPTMLTDDELNEAKASIVFTDYPSQPVSLEPAVTERYIGIDQGIKTFSMVAVDKTSNGLPKVVGAVQVNLQELGLLARNGKFSAANVLLMLEKHSPLLQWMQTERAVDSTAEWHELEPVDRVVVLIEQISIENAYSKQLGKQLGEALQQQFDISKCIVKMSQPHVHRKNGPMFKLGDDLIKACHLQAPSYESLQTRINLKRHADSENSNRNEQPASKTARTVSEKDDEFEPCDSRDTVTQRQTTCQ
jgi:hypothetical protein